MEHQAAVFRGCLGIVWQSVDDCGVLSVGTDDTDRTLRGSSENYVFAGGQGLVSHAESEGDADCHEPMAWGCLSKQVTIISALF